MPHLIRAAPCVRRVTLEVGDPLKYAYPVSAATEFRPEDGSWPVAGSWTTFSARRYGRPVNPRICCILVKAGSRGLETARGG